MARCSAGDDTSTTSLDSAATALPTKKYRKVGKRNKETNGDESPAFVHKYVDPINEGDKSCHDDNRRSTYLPILRLNGYPASSGNRIRWGYSAAVKLIPYRRMKVWYLEDLKTPPRALAHEQEQVQEQESGAFAAVVAPAPPKGEASRPKDRPSNPREIPDDLAQMGYIPDDDLLEEEEDDDVSVSAEIERVIGDIDPAKREHLIEGMMLEIMQEFRDDKAEQEEEEERPEEGKGQGGGLDSLFEQFMMDEQMDDFIRARAMEWIDEAKESDEEDDDEEEGGDEDASASDEEDLTLKHSFLTEGDKLPVDMERKVTHPAAGPWQVTSERPNNPRPRPHPRPSGSANKDGRKPSTTKNKKKKKSPFKRRFKNSLQGEMAESKQRAKILRISDEISMQRSSSGSGSRIHAPQKKTTSGRGPPRRGTPASRGGSRGRIRGGGSTGGGRAGASSGSRLLSGGGGKVAPQAVKQPKKKKKGMFSMSSLKSELDENQYAHMLK